MTYLALGVQQMRDPLTKLGREIVATTPAQVTMPSGPPSALPLSQARLELAASRMGASVTYGPLGPGWYGATKHAERAITINETLNADMRTMTLAHELAHLLQPPGLDKGDEEMWADSVAYLVTRDESDRLLDSARYLAWWKGHANVLQVYRREILFAAALLRGEVE
jgi:hypothetical protein